MPVPTLPPQDVQHQVSATATPLSKVIWPALATLVPLSVTTAFKWGQDHSRKRLRTELTERISTFAKNIAELDLVLRELTAPQNKLPRRVIGISGGAASIKAMLPLFKPKDFLAWMLHLAFYIYSILLLAFFLTMATDHTTPLISTKTASDFFSDLIFDGFMFGLLGIPPMVLRYFAANPPKRNPRPSLAGPGYPSTPDGANAATTAALTAFVTNP